MNRVVTIVVLVPIAIVVIALAVANRGVVPFTLDPFNPGNPGLTIEWPLFVLLFVTLAIGLVLGSVATWFRQGRNRKAARERASEVRALRDQAMRAAPPVQPTLPKPGA
jgi:uncharacterized integral membrane protein